VDRGSAQRARVRPNLRLPRVALSEVLRGWNGDGTVYAALAAIQDPDLEIRWTENDIRRRAGRVLLARMEEAILRLPATAEEWAEYLPVSIESQKTISQRPIHPTNWAATSRQFGWPPRQFVTSPKSRVYDEAALKTLAWTAATLERMAREARPLGPDLIARLRAPVNALAVIARSELLGVSGIRPDRLDLISLRASGRPWSNLADVASDLARAETDLEFLAFELIEPDPELDWRLFHLSVLGALLKALRTKGAHIGWLAPLAAAQLSGPQFRVTLPGGAEWDLWFEAAGATGHYGAESIYGQATAAITGNRGTTGADLMLIAPGKRALIIECKWSPEVSRVGRDGFHQAASYALQARAQLAKSVWSYVVGPSEIVSGISHSMGTWNEAAVILGCINIDFIPIVVDNFLREDPEIHHGQA
jgi:hypothetical protein